MEKHFLGYVDHGKLSKGCQSSPRLQRSLTLGQIKLHCQKDPKLKAANEECSLCNLLKISLLCNIRRQTMKN